MLTPILLVRLEKLLTSSKENTRPTDSTSFDQAMRTALAGQEAQGRNSRPLRQSVDMNPGQRTERSATEGAGRPLPTRTQLSDGFVADDVETTEAGRVPVPRRGEGTKHGGAVTALLPNSQSGAHVDETTEQSDHAWEETGVVSAPVASGYRVEIRGPVASHQPESRSVETGSTVEPTADVPRAESPLSAGSQAARVADRTVEMSAVPEDSEHFATTGSRDSERNVRLVEGPARSEPTFAAGEHRNHAPDAPDASAHRLAPAGKGQSDASDHSLSRFSEERDASKRVPGDVEKVWPERPNVSLKGLEIAVDGDQPIVRSSVVQPDSQHNGVEQAKPDPILTGMRSSQSAARDFRPIVVDDGRGAPDPVRQDAADQASFPQSAPMPQREDSIRDGRGANVNLTTGDVPRMPSTTSGDGVSQRVDGGARSNISAFERQPVTIVARQSEGATALGRRDEPGGERSARSAAREPGTTRMGSSNEGQRTMSAHPSSSVPQAPVVTPDDGDVLGSVRENPGSHRANSVRPETGAEQPEVVRDRASTAVSRPELRGATMVDTSPALQRFGLSTMQAVDTQEQPGSRTNIPERATSPNTRPAREEQERAGRHDDTKARVTANVDSPVTRSPAPHGERMVASTENPIRVMEATTDKGPASRSPVPSAQRAPIDNAVLRPAGETATMRIEDASGKSAHIRVTVRGDQVHTRIVHENQEVAGHLTAKSDELHDALRGQGFKDSGLSVRAPRSGLEAGVMHVSPRTTGLGESVETADVREDRQYDQRHERREEQRQDRRDDFREPRSRRHNRSREDSRRGQR